jgi:uncharacterized membrane protein YidH (DUF202 family)
MVESVEAPLDPGLQGERTTLSWSRTGLSVVANGALLLRAAIETPTPALSLAICAPGLVLALLTWSQARHVYRRGRRALLESTTVRRRQEGMLLSATTCTLAVSALVVCLQTN